MTLLLWIIGAYILLGIFAIIYVFKEEPLLLYAKWFIIIFFLFWPYILWAVITSDKSGRWI